MKILVVQTAFLGDVILTLPLVQMLKAHIPESSIDFLAIPASVSVLENHPALRDVIAYDKNGAEAGVGGFRKHVRNLQERSYDCAIVPHRSLRSAALARMAKIPRRIGFDRSSGAWLFTHIVRYDASSHEVERNTRLLSPLGIEVREKVLPDLYPSDSDRDTVDRLLTASGIGGGVSVVAVAPGSVWTTKRWPKERFAELARQLAASGQAVVIVGGEADQELGNAVVTASGSSKVLSLAGRMTLLQSAALIGKSRLLVTNDTAPMHIAVAMRTPVVAMFGATVPSFGFAPYGERDIVLETNGLSCRPCSIHGGDRCPIATFDCMMNISVEAVYGRVLELLGTPPAPRATGGSR